jgi:hypothetical protein
MHAGAAGVVAMRYSVFVVTAAQFMADMYGHLAQGEPLGEAASFARKQLHAQPLREIAFDPRPLQDWMVPVVFEAEPMALFPRKGSTGFLCVAASPELEGLVSSTWTRRNAGIARAWTCCQTAIGWPGPPALANWVPSPTSDSWKRARRKNRSPHS